jgi:hypothetical protein
MTQAAILAASGSPGTTTGFKNRIINGNMMISQRNGTTATSQTNGGYSLDRWQSLSYTGGGTTGKFTVTQSSTAPAGFINSLLVTSSAATSSAANDIYTVGQVIEGLNIADLGWGTSSGKSATLSFWVRSSATGTFGGSVRNQDGTYCFPFTYSIATANTFSQITVNMPPPTVGGNWQTDNSAGINVFFGLQVGSSFTQTATGAWQSGGVYSASGCVNLLNNSGATFYLTGVQLEVGTTATNFDFRSYGTELGLCYRYYYQMNGVTNQDILVGTACDQTTWLRYGFALPTTMRSTPSLVSAGGTSYANLISSGGRASTSISLDNSSATNATVNLYSAGISAGTTGTFRLQAGLYLGLSAEL